MQVRVAHKYFIAYICVSCRWAFFERDPPDAFSPSISLRRSLARSQRVCVLYKRDEERDKSTAIFPRQRHIKHRRAPDMMMHYAQTSALDLWLFFSLFYWVHFTSVLFPAACAKPPSAHLSAANCILTFDTFINSSSLADCEGAQ